MLKSILVFSAAIVAHRHGVLASAKLRRPADFSGLYRPAGLEVQPCGRNEWMRRSFETDTFCGGDDSAFPFTARGPRALEVVQRHRRSGARLRRGFSAQRDARPADAVTLGDETSPRSRTGSTTSGSCARCT